MPVPNHSSGASALARVETNSADADKAARMIALFINARFMTFS
jgi:hypothetical protein